MRIKKFVGTTLQDVTGQMKADLGPDAIVLNTRKVNKGGLLNFVGSEMFEITAAVDDEVMPTTNSYAPPDGGLPDYRQRQSAVSSKQSGGRASLKQHAFDGLAQVAQEFEKRNQRGPVSLLQRRSQEPGGLIELKTEVEEMKSTLREIASHLKYANMPALPDLLKRVYSTLIEQDVDEQFASDLVQSAYLKLGEDAMDNETAVENYVLDALSRVLKTIESAAMSKQKPGVIALVGATGVGKTTTIAKLAVQSKLTGGLSVGLISADTYRIGAIEQLQTFAAIADIPMEVVYSPDEMNQAIRKFKEKDVVYIDTVGRNHYRKDEVEEVAEFVNSAEADEVHLVLSASTQSRTILESVKRFSIVKPNRLLITKTDETASFGSLISLMQTHPIPVSFVTTGQAVPDDIVAVRPGDLATMVYKGVLPHV